MTYHNSLGQNHLKTVRTVSEGMLRITQNRRFLRWVSRQLLGDLNPSHISVALYDPYRDSFPIRVSAGENRIPPSLIELGHRNALVRWFENPGSAPLPARLHHIVTLQDLKNCRDPLPGAVQREMIAHHSEICARIEPLNHPCGFLLVGPSRCGRRYSREDLVFVRILANDIAIEIEREEYLHLSQVDPLTGLLNRNSLDIKLPEMMRRVAESETLLGAALIDLDHFKRINDRYGHPAGDAVLSAAAAMIRDGVRKSDYVFRYGGEEILVLLHLVFRNQGDPPVKLSRKRLQILQVLERLRMQIASRPIRAGSSEIPLTISAGISVYAGEIFKTGEQLLREADIALYQSKRNGRNRITLFENPDAGD